MFHDAVPTLDLPFHFWQHGKVKQFLPTADVLLKQRVRSRTGLLLTVVFCLLTLFVVSGEVGVVPATKDAIATPTALPRVFKPAVPRQAESRFPWKTDIKAGVTVIGKATAWDAEWRSNYGGPDPLDSKSRTVGYCPADFIPKLNPFYVALPYNDVSKSSQTKPEASIKIPWFKDGSARPGGSVLKDRWVAIRFGNRVAYAQWEDCGPGGADDVEYVFGNARPKNSDGIEVSPAVRDYLGLSTDVKIDWRFVDAVEVPDGPWHSYSTTNPFTRAKSSEKGGVLLRIEELRRQRDEFFRRNGKSQ